MAPTTPLPIVTAEDIHDCMSTSSRKQARNSNTPTGCRLTKATARAASFSVVTAVFSAALAVCFAASRACFAYCRLIFCFWIYRDTAPPFCISGWASTVARY